MKYLKIILLILTISCGIDKSQKIKVESQPKRTHFLSKNDLFFLNEVNPINHFKENIGALKKIITNTKSGLLFKMKYLFSDHFKYGKIENGQGLGSALLSIKKMKPEFAIEIIDSLKNEVDLKYLRPGDQFFVRFNDNFTNIDRFEYRTDLVTSHILERDSSGALNYTEIKRKTDDEFVIYRGTLNGTLDQSLLQSGISPYLKQAVNGIMECAVDLRYSARNGDDFLVLVEESRYDDYKIPGGKVMYVKYSGKKTGSHEAYRYDDMEKSSAYTAHYTKEGKALIHSAIRYPLDKIHITSHFGRRVHPVTGARSYHNGVDYRARTGTNVYAVSSGVVVKAGYGDLEGKMVAVRHADNTESYYLHLNSISVRKGNSVKSGQIIGKSGNTGRSTGPHLHFGIKQNGKWVNPLNKRMIATPKLEGERYEKFQQQMKDIDKILSETLINKDEKLLTECDSINESKA
ncbi:MAG: M23 family metallopeptidase [Candidatus Delongbacteria bacterium]|nr:M23 family metallopeptidase [Candidatus Delongbacteria bacterium]MBN2835851.1 M23 family metallopeptidase [Candidatus Delongbacteria bacterium]